MKRWARDGTIGVDESRRGVRQVTEGRTVPLRPLGVAELLDGAVRLVRHNPAAAFTLALPFALARTLVVAVVALSSVGSKDTSTLQLATILGATGLFGTMRTGVLAPVYAADLAGSRVAAGPAAGRVVRRLPALGAMAAVVMIAEGTGTLALAAGGVWLWGVWAVAAPALAVEGLGPMRALGRSVRLVRTAFWRVWGRRALGWAMTYALSIVVTVPFNALAYLATGTNPFDVAGTVAHGVHDPRLFVLITSLGELVAAMLVGPIGSAVDVLLYFDLRMRREGMDLAMSLPAASASFAPTPTPTPTLPVTPPSGVTAW